jgi:hypothetical protein
VAGADDHAAQEFALAAVGKNVDEVERQIRRIVDRAFKDLREDSDAFGHGQ